MSVYRCYSQKKPGFDVEAQGLCKALREQLGVAGLTSVAILNRYDADQIDPAVYQQAKGIVFSEPQVDVVYDETFPQPAQPCALLAVEALPGQFDQRADSCAQCIQLMAGVERPLIAYAKVYVLQGQLSQEDLSKIRHYLINPVESREASMDKPETLVRTHETPDHVPTIDGFISMDEKALAALLDELGLAMDLDDLKFLQTYFRTTRAVTPPSLRSAWSTLTGPTTAATPPSPPTWTMWTIHDAAMSGRLSALSGRTCGGLRRGKGRPAASDPDGHCHHRREGPEEAGPAARAGRERGDQCLLHPRPRHGGRRGQDWLLMFKNETHNHPTEIEPFGGAATCIGGCIRDPLSGRAYVHQAMRVTGAANPRALLSRPLDGKLPQRKLATPPPRAIPPTATRSALPPAMWRSCTTRATSPSVWSAARWLRGPRLRTSSVSVPPPATVVILLGGRTGRDGIGGATGSSKSHNMKSLTTMACEVQKGNAPEERKIQRLFRNGAVTRLIKRCNDFGAGGVSVAIGELADGLRIELDAVRKKYDGLDGTELAISEAQERMAVVVAPRKM